jgi:hypothetical protein
VAAGCLGTIDSGQHPVLPNLDDDGEDLSRVRKSGEGEVLLPVRHVPHPAALVPFLW